MDEPAPETATTTWPNSSSLGRFLAHAAVVAALFFGTHIALEWLMGGDMATSKRTFIAVVSGLTMAGSWDYWTVQRIRRALGLRP